MKSVVLNRLVVGLLTCVVALMSMSAVAKSTKDPNHKGWTGKHPSAKHMQWTPVKVKCDRCTKLAAQYNEVVQQLLESRYWVGFWLAVKDNRNADKKTPFWPGKGDISNFESRAVGANLELFEYQAEQLTLHKALVKSLEQQASYLRSAIAQCETGACGEKKPTKTKDIKVGGQVIAGGFQPDVANILKLYGIDWRGPYTTNCLPCQPHVQQLNALPGWVVRAHYKKQVAEHLVKYGELIAKSNKIKLDSIQYHHPDKGFKASQAQAALDAANSELATYKKYFTQLLSKKAECERRYCNASTATEPIGSVGTEPIGYNGSFLTCPEPAANEPMIVGANSDIGSSANFREKTKKKLTGAATKAITGLLGIGGGGGGKAAGPPTYKDPVKNKLKTKVKSKNPKREIRTGGVFTEDGLLISTDIKNAPGQGTFQTVYLQNPRGWRLMPIGIYMYEIWREWKLSVSWTRDTYVDGELVKHEEGGWSESWRELIARGEEIIYQEVYDGPLWEHLGFNTAVSGARSMGTLFPVSPQMLLNEPLNLVIHVTDPKQDPVVTVPYIFALSINAKGQIEAQPMEQTYAQEGNVCDAYAQSMNMQNTEQTPVGSNTVSAGGSSDAPEQAAGPGLEASADPDADAGAKNTNANEFSLGVDRDSVERVLTSPSFNYRKPGFTKERALAPTAESQSMDPSAATEYARPSNFHSVLKDIESSQYHTVSQSSDDMRMVSAFTTNEKGGLGKALSILFAEPKSGCPDASIVVGEKPPSSHNYGGFYFFRPNPPGGIRPPPKPDADGHYPGHSFRLIFNEPVDLELLESDFLIRSFTDEKLSIDESVASEFGEVSNQDGTYEVFDQSNFEVSWNEDRSAVEFRVSLDPDLNLGDE